MQYIPAVMQQFVICLGLELATFICILQGYFIDMAAIIWLPIGKKATLKNMRTKMK